MNEAPQKLRGKSILISAGGTGGHVYPALAVANELIAQGANVTWLGTDAGIENYLVPQANIPMHTLSVRGLRGNGIKRLLKAPFEVGSAVLQARKIIQSIDADIYIGFGGFASGPGALAAKLLRIPVVIHEQNAAMGLTNRIVSRWARKVLLAFPIENRSGTVTGNPIRKSICEISEPKSRMQQAAPFRILVIGGSLGSKAINDIIPDALTPLLDRIQLTHQTGKGTYIETVSRYAEKQIKSNVNVVQYIDNIDEMYANTDLVIARAGALTVSEIASVGLPAIFIPLPFAVDNHQFLNAQFLEVQGASVIIEQKNLTAKSLRNEVEKILEAKTLLDMANKARHLSHAQALPTITNHITELLQ